MVNLKNNTIFFNFFILLLSACITFSCVEQKNVITNVETKKIAILENYPQETEIENFIKPYREHIDKDLNEIIAYNPENMDKKDGKWQTNIGNLMADICFERGNVVFNKRENKSMDFCLLNHGGIRSIMPKGPISTKVAFQIMPFENSLYIMELKGEQVLELVNYIITEKKPHPLSGLSFTIGKNNLPKKILIQGKPLDLNKIYFVGTNDYLSNGGDNMNFFKKNVGSHDMDYKLRNILIDYLRAVDTVKVDKSVRIIEE
jgi:2',3'-cyclic-nucleotide 2'-phosphodiesterase (5'-nucleotidase family)